MVQWSDRVDFSREAWEKCRAGDRQTLEDIARTYLPVALRIAKSIQRRYDLTSADKKIDNVEVQEYAMDALIKAIRLYNPNKRVKFATFLYRKIQFNIFDLITYHYAIKRFRKEALFSLDSSYQSRKRDMKKNFHYILFKKDRRLNRLEDEEEIDKILKEAKLNKQEITIAKYLIEGKIQREIGSKLKLSEGRISQIISSRIRPLINILFNERYHGGEIE